VWSASFRLGAVTRLTALAWRQTLSVCVTLAVGAVAGFQPPLRPARPARRKPGLWFSQGGWRVVKVWAGGSLNVPGTV